MKDSIKQNDSINMNKIIFSQSKKKTVNKVERIRLY